MSDSNADARAEGEKYAKLMGFLAFYAPPAESESNLGTVIRTRSESSVSDSNQIRIQDLIFERRRPPGGRMET